MPINTDNYFDVQKIGSLQNNSNTPGYASK